MKNKLNTDIIEAIKRSLPPSQQLLPFLMNLLFLGKEAIYRRLRGDVAFSFDEVARISSKLGFSLDTISGLEQSKRILFDANLHKKTTWEDTFYYKMLDYVNFFTELDTSKKVTARFVNNCPPYMFSTYFETLSKFRYYKWMHQIDGLEADCPMGQILVPPKLLDLHTQWGLLTDTQKMDATYIFDNNLFVTTCRDISFFYQNHLLSKQEVEALQCDLNELIDTLEEMARTGVVPASGVPIRIYVQAMDLGANYMHFEYDNNIACYIHIHNIDHLRSHDRAACTAQKNWIELLKRYSISITQSAEMLRLAYFKTQRKYVLQIGTNSNR